MVNPNKAERNFLSRMFRTISLYMLVALCSFFGYIMIVGDVTISFELPENSASADENSNLTALMENVMSANNLEGDFNVEVSGDINLSVQGNVMVDMKNFDFQFTSQIVLNEETYQVNAFKDEELVYFYVNDLSYKLDTTAIENFDFSTLLSYVQANVNTDELLKYLSHYAGVDLSNLDLNSLMTELSIKENNVEEGYRFTISLGSLVATINCDENFNNLSLSLREINYGGYNIKASVDSVKLNGEDFSITSSPTGEETDITSLLQIVENAKLDENTYALSSDLTISVGDLNVSGDIMAMLVQKGNDLVPYVRLKLNEFEGFEGYIYLIDNTIYINAQNLLLKLDLKDLNEDKLNEIESVLKEYGVDLEAVKTISVILPTLENIKLELLESGLQVAVDDVVIGDKISLNSINVSVTLSNVDEVILPYSAEVLATLTDLESGENKSVKILVDNIKIGKNTQNLEDITFEENEIFLQTNLDKKNLNEFADIVPLTSIITNALGTKTLQGNVNLEVSNDKNKVDLLGFVKFDLNSLSISAELTLKYEDVEVDVKVYGFNLDENHLIYISLGGEVFALDIDNIEFERLLKDYGISEPTISAMEVVKEIFVVDINNLDLVNLSNRLNLKEIENGYKFTFDEKEIKINYNDTLNIFNIDVSAISYEGYEVKVKLNDVKINASDFAIDFVPTGEETEISSILYIEEHARLNQTEDATTYALSSDLSISVNENTFTGNIMARIVKTESGLTPYFRVKIDEFEGFEGYIYLIDNTVYINAQNLLLKLDIADLTEEKLSEIKEVLTNFGFSMEEAESFTLVLPTLSEISINWIENGINITTENGLTINEEYHLSNINLSLITSNENEVILPEEVKISAILNNLTNSTQNEFELTLSSINLGKSSKYLEDIALNENNIFVQTNLDKKNLNEFADIMPLTSIITNALGTKTLQGNVNLEVSNDKNKVDLLGFVKFDLNSLSISAELTLKYEDVEVDVKVYGFNLDENHLIYISLGGEVFALDIDNLDFERLLKDYGISEPTISAMEVVKEIFAVDINNLDFANLSNRLNLKEIENGYALTLDEKEIKINYNDTFNIFNIDVSAISYEGYEVKVKLNDVKINASDFAIDFVPTGEETEISSILYIEEHARLNQTEDATTYALSSDLSISVDENTFTGNIMARIVKTESGLTPYLRVKIDEFKGFEGYIYLIDNTMYLNAQNLLLKLDIADLTEEKLSEIKELLTNFGFSMEEAENFTLVLPTLSEISINWMENGINIATENGLTINEEYHLSNINLSLITSNENEVILPEEVKISAILNNLTNSTQNEFELTLSSINLGKSSKYLEDITFEENNIFVQTNLDKKNLNEFADIAPLTSIITNTLGTKTLQGDVNLQVSKGEFKVDLTGFVKFDLDSLSVSADLTLEYENVSVDAKVYGFNLDENHLIYISLGGEIFALDIDNLDFERLMKDYGISQPAIDAVDVIKDIISVDINNLDLVNLSNRLNLTEIENGYALTLDEKEIKINYNETFNIFNFDVSVISYEGYEVKVKLNDVKLNASDFAIDFVPTGEETEISSILYIEEYARLNQTEDATTYALSSDLSISVDENTFTGNIMARIVKTESGLTPYLRVKIDEFKGFEGYVYLIDNTMYLNAQNLLLKLDIADLTEEKLSEIKEVLTNFGISMEEAEKFTIILPTLSEISINWMENGINITTENGLTINEEYHLSNINLSLITSNENDVILPEEVKVSATLNNLTNSAQNEFELTLSSVKLGKNSLHLEDIAFGENSISLQTNTGMTTTDKFMDAMKIFDLAKNLLETKTVEGKIDLIVENGETKIDVEGVAKFDLVNMAVSADLTLNYEGLNVSLAVYGFNIDVNRTIYLTYDNRTFALNIDNIDLSSFMETSEEVDVAETIVNIVKDVFEIDINNIDIANIANRIYLNEIENGYVITLDDKTITLNHNDLFNVFSVDLSKISYKGFDVKASLNDFKINTPDFSIDYTPTGEETEISSMFKLVENAKINENTYAFSGNLAVRYSTTSFYGNILAMLVESENGFVPYIRIYTSSMNLNTYIYLLDKTIYLDLQGLKLTFDLDESSINEILSFVQENFGMELANTTVALSIILPKLSAITHGWSVDNGLQIDISDNLYYTENSYFKDIVLQAFMTEIDTQILLTSVVIGANIVDPNTEIYDDYSDYLLNGEKSATANKNFAVYIDNILIGKSADYQNSITFENGEVSAVVGFNDVSFGVEEFVDIHVLMDIVEKALNYINSNTFQIRIDASLQNGKNETRIGGDVILSITKAVKENEAETKVGFTLFGGKRLKLQADLTIENYAPQLDETTNEETMVKTAEHQISIYYDSNQVDENGYVQSDLGGLYISYTHDQNIGTNYFRGHIQNTDLNNENQKADMSDLIALILNFANIEIGDEAMESWQLTENTTDFRFIQELLGIGGNDLSDEITETDKILGDVSNILAMIDSISFNKNEQNAYELAVAVDLGDNMAEISVIFDENNNLSIVNAGSSFENNNITASIEVQDYNEANFDYNINNSHFDLSNIPEFLDIAVNTLNTKSFNYQGTIVLEMTKLATIDINVDLFGKFDENNELSLYVELGIVPNGLSTLAFDSLFKSRTTQITIEHGVMSIIRHTTKIIGSETHEATYKLSEINTDNMLTVIDDILGFSSLAESIIKTVIENITLPTPTIEEAMKEFSVTDTGYRLGLDGYNVTGMDGIQDIVYVDLGVSDGYQVAVDNEDLGQYEKTLKFIESISTSLNVDDMLIVDLTLKSVSGTSYQTSLGKTIYTNEWYRQQYISSIGTLK